MRAFLLFVLFSFSFLVNSAAQSDAIDVGDELRIAMPNESEFSNGFKVDLKGKITLPEIGKIYVKGKTLTQLTSELKLALASVYRDVDTVTVEFGSREKLITVLGYVNTPSQIAIPALGNVQMALNMAGGMKPGAQLDNFQLQRGASVIVFNFKRYLETGNEAELPALKSGDTLFVPSSPLTGNVQIPFDAATLKTGGDASDKQKAVIVFGEVKNPGTFAFEPGLTIVESLMKANGVTRYANVSKIRVMKSGKPRIFDLNMYLDTGDKSLLPDIEAGTTVFVPIQVEDVKVGLLMVYVMGQVNKPGAYEGREGISFMDMLANAGGPNRYADTQQIRVLKANGETFRFDLTKHADNPLANPYPDIAAGDIIFLPEKSDLNEKSWLKEGHDYSIKIIGAVKNPGRFEWDDSMTFLDLLGHAEGPTEKADLARINIVKNDGEGKRFEFNLEEFMKKGGDYLTLPQLSGGDTILVRELPDDPSDNKSKWIKQPSSTSVYVLGSVGAPGRYAFNTTLDFLDLLAAADGPNKDADIKHIRVTHRNNEYASSSLFDLDLYFETGDESILPSILPGDTIYIPSRGEKGTQTNTTNIVQVLGAVNNPGRYKYDSTVDLVGMLTMAGGMTSEAYIDRIIVITKYSELEHRTKAFNLTDYLTEPDPRQMPIIHPGDTIYIPNEKESNWQQLGDILGRAFNVLSLLIVGASL